MQSENVVVGESAFTDGYKVTGQCDREANGNLMATEELERF